MRFTKVHQPTPRAFSAWLQPRMGKYLLACCDCGLVHEVQFRIATGPLDKRGGQRMHVQLRARRAVAHTASLRRKSK